MKGLFQYKDKMVLRLFDLYTCNGIPVPWKIALFVKNVDREIKSMA